MHVVDLVEEARHQSPTTDLVAASTHLMLLHVGGHAHHCMALLDKMCCGLAWIATMLCRSRCAEQTSLTRRSLLIIGSSFNFRARFESGLYQTNQPAKCVRPESAGPKFGHAHISGLHEAAAKHEGALMRGLEAGNYLGFSYSTRMAAGLYIGNPMTPEVQERWFRFFDSRNERLFEVDCPILLGPEDWLKSYIDPGAASGMKKWVASISWPGGLILSVQDMFDHVLR